MKKKVLLIIVTILAYLAYRGFKNAKPFLNLLKATSPHLNYILGIDKPTNYLFLLGNDTESRANGGFAGSYAKVTLDNKRVTKLDFQDIYVPNGQLGGYVKPPEPIQQAFRHGTWELANADFDPNFPTAATSIRWFLEKGKEVNPDILGIINLSSIKKVLQIVGPVKIVGQDTVITPENLYLYLQGKAELNFFPGSTQKADALHTVGTAVFKKMINLSWTKKISITKTIYNDFKNQNIVLNSLDQDFQSFLESQLLAGVYKSRNTYDTYGLVEVNLGANKANAYVTRQTNHQVASEDNQIKHTVSVSLQNSATEANPNPPLHYGGNYIAYMRIYLPSNATDIEVTTSEIATGSAEIPIDIFNSQKPVILPQSADASLTTLGFWHITLHSNTSYINLKYNLPDIKPEDYSLSILKQNGFPSSPQTLKVFSRDLTTSLESTFTYSANKE